MLSVHKFNVGDRIRVKADAPTESLAVKEAKGKEGEVVYADNASVSILWDGKTFAYTYQKDIVHFEVIPVEVVVELTEREQIKADMDAAAKELQAATNALEEARAKWNRATMAHREFEKSEDMAFLNSLGIGSVIENRKEFRLFKVNHEFFVDKNGDIVRFGDIPNPRNWKVSVRGLDIPRPAALPF
jgi:hypothetical protein